MGVDRNIFRYDSEARITIRSRYGIRDNDIVFLYVGKIILERGVHLLVNAGIELCDKYHNVKMMFVGGSYRAYLEKIRDRLRKLSLMDKFIFIHAAPHEQLYQFYSAADV